MDPNLSLTPKLLEEVFNEVEALEGLASKKKQNATKLGFLEDVVSMEKEILCGNKKSKVKSLQEQSFLDQLDCSNNVQEDKSVIHEGLIDSSDDEDDKYFEKSSYNECGRILKNLIKQKSTKTDWVTTPKSIESKSTNEKLKATLESFSGNISANKDILENSIFGMKIINPLISSGALKEKMLGRIFISTLKIKNFLETQASKEANWVTGGAIVNKFIKTSQRGNQYCVWHLTDLNGDIKTVCVFLFGSAYKEYCNISLGSVIGVLNPGIMDNKEKFEATLRIDNAQKILVMGISKDYGLCKSKKKNGQNCLTVVNKSKCDYCVYHIKKEYSKACRRSDLQPPKIGRSLDNLRAKVLGRNQVFYGGKAFTGVIGKKISRQLEKDQQRLKMLSQSSELESKFRKQKDDKILKILTEGPKIQALKPQNKHIPVVMKPESQMIDLGFTVSKKERNAAKANALKYIRQHGPLKKLVDVEKTKRTTDQISSIKRKLEEEEEKKGKKSKVTDDITKDPSQEKHSKNGITEEFLKLMNSDTRNVDLLKMAENEEREKYFSKLEMKEKIENKMASTFKVECKAVRCLQCNYKAFSASDFCKKEKHPLKVVNAVKRFWKCGNCSARSVCLELVPLHSCKICGSSKWEKTSMMPERKDLNVTKVPLSLRGDEETFIGTVTKQANLNLLVPEEAS